MIASVPSTTSPVSSWEADWITLDLIPRRGMENNSSNIMSREKIDQMALWLGSTLSSAFFSSLERFSCVNLSTNDPDCDDDDEDVDVPHSALAKSIDLQVNAYSSKDVADVLV